MCVCAVCMWYVSSVCVSVCVVCVCVCEPGYGTLGGGGCCREVTDGCACVVAQRRH